MDEFITKLENLILDIGFISTSKQIETTLDDHFMAYRYRWGEYYIKISLHDDQTYMYGDLYTLNNEGYRDWEMSKWDIDKFEQSLRLYFKDIIRKNRIKNIIDSN